MKRSLPKRIGAALAAFAMLAALVPAEAALACSSGNHTPGSERHDPNYTPCMGGFTDPWYECTDCGAPVDANGQEMVFQNGTGTQTPGSERKAPH